MSSTSSKSPPAGAHTTPFTPRIQFANLPLSVAILFGMWVCFEASSGRPMHPWLDPFKTVGLFFFRAEWMIRLVFWLAVVAHVWEGVVGARFAWKVSKGRVVADVSQNTFVLFWLVQTLLVGFPSLKLIKEQRRQQLQSVKHAAGASTRANAASAAANAKAQ